MRERGQMILEEIQRISFMCVPFSCLYPITHNPVQFNVRYATSRKLPLQSLPSHSTSVVPGSTTGGAITSRKEVGGLVAVLHSE